MVAIFGHPSRGFYSRDVRSRLKNSASHFLKVEKERVDSLQAFLLAINRPKEEILYGMIFQFFLFYETNTTRLLQTTE